MDKILFFKDGKPKIDEKDITSVKTRGYYWYPICMIERLNFLFNGEKINLSKIKSSVKSLEEIAAILDSKGFNTYTIDITPQKLRESGFYVVKAIIPNLHPLYLDERYPCLYSERLIKHLNGRKINLAPHPFL